MKCLRTMALCLSVMLTGCSTFSANSWSKAYPWNWFGNGITLNDEGLGNIRADTVLNQKTIQDALGNNYQVRSGMKMQNGALVNFYETLRDNKLAVVIEGKEQKVDRITVLDPEIATRQGIKIGTTFGSLYSKAYGACSPGSGDNDGLVVCKAPDNPHLYYLFAGQWQGPEGLIPADEILKAWKLSKMVWMR